MNAIKDRFLGLLKNSGEDGLPAQDDEFRFYEMTEGQTASSSDPARWLVRSQAIQAADIPTSPALSRLTALWEADPIMASMSARAVERLGPLLNFYSVPAQREIIQQDEVGDFMLVLLRGAVSVVRQQDNGDNLVLANVGPGEILGEMSLLDGGPRFSTCITQSECEIAVITTEHLEQAINAEPHITARLIAALARKLSLRLRVVSSRLGGRQH